MIIIKKKKKHRSSTKDLAVLSQHSFLLHTQVIGYAVGFNCYSTKRQLFREEAEKGKRNVCKAFIFKGTISIIVFEEDKIRIIQG